VEACPEVRFVLDHIGKPAIREGALDPWRAGIDRLARLPNVVCKLSGVATEADHDAWTPDELHPYIRHALDAFGPDRTLFGSDWPVSRLAIELPRWIDVVDGAVAHLAEADRRKVFVDTARAVYRLDA
jgi:L-fuconolactonase